MCFAVPCLFLEAYCISLCRLALLKRYWLVFFRPPWSGTARCRPGRRMVRLGLWKWAFMHYVGYSSVFIGDGELIFLFCLTTGLTATQRSNTSTVTWPRFRPSSSSWRAADHTSNVRPSWETLFEMNPKPNDVWLQIICCMWVFTMCLCRWQGADPGGVVWCRGHCSAGGLLDRTGAKQIGVRTFALCIHS